VDLRPLSALRLTCWDYFVIATKQGCQCFFAGEAYIRQHPTPLAIFPLRVALAETFQFCMSLSVLMGLVWYVNGFGNLPALVSLVPTFMLCSRSSGRGRLSRVHQRLLPGHAASARRRVPGHLLHDADRLPCRGLGPDGWHGSWQMQSAGAVAAVVRRPILEGRVPSLETYVSARPSSSW
jgi:hypothetical protein